MIVLILCCVVSAVGANVFKIFLADGVGTNLTKILYWALTLTYYTMNCILHTFFVIKYWVLSKKVQACFLNVKEPRIELEAKLLLCS
jgi:hypothetical protein